ncbi:DUF3152 domain-containing protein [Micromonospora sp. CPCC 206061]|uniref:DUF3152 domain-containing protein n=1 Tax=Micromonospora sp. CPCC 206061 TaxID=3122410 RepID=UPI002FF02975
MATPATRPARATADRVAAHGRTPAPRLEGRRIGQERMRHRQRRTAVLLLLASAAGLVLVDLARSRPVEVPVAAPEAPPTTAAAVVPAAVALRPTSPSPAAPSPTPAAVATTFPVTGPGTFRYADSAGPPLGTAGTLRRFRVATEDGLGQDARSFAASVDEILGDPRSWIAGRQFRLQRVPRSASAEFTIFLATPATSERMCAAGGLATEQYTSCRLPGQVIINVARWLTAVPDYGAPLAEYQAYAINHEVGHQLGHGHERCPTSGGTAPVMQQQTLGLKGCVAYGWPYLNGRRYAGPPIP